MVYILSTMLRKAFQNKEFNTTKLSSIDDIWKILMLEPKDYSS